MRRGAKPTRFSARWPAASSPRHSHAGAERRSDRAGVRYNQPVLDLGSLKTGVAAMLQERARLPPGAAPSSYWSETCSAFDYMLGLPNEAFGKLRVHTYHLTGDNYQYYVFHQGEIRLWKTWQSLTAGLPTEYVLFEPEGTVQSMGFQTTDGRRVSHDILRFQEIVTTLYRESALTRLPPRPMILEIGGGYGGLAHHLSRLTSPQTYIIVDLPETLLFSGAYLSLLNPDKRVTLYDANDPEHDLDGDFVLVPNYRLSLLKSRRFDMAFNIASMQEMRTDQAEAYLAFIAETCRGMFYCHNLDRLPLNTELTSLVNLLHTYFDVTEIPRPAARRRRLRATLKSIAALVGLADREVATPPYRTFLCRPRK